MAAIVGLGGVCLDRLAILPRMPGWDEVEHISSSATQLGGMVATAMVAAARLGESAEMIGGVGNDDAGRYALETLKREGVITQNMQVIDDEATAFSFVLVHQETGQRTILHQRGVQAGEELPPATFDLAGVRFLHLDGYWFRSALRAAQQAKAHGVTVTLDPSTRLLHADAEELFYCVDYFMPGIAFVEQFMAEREPFRAAKTLLKYGGKAVILTNGAEGVYVCAPDDEFHIPAFRVPVVDTTGAGDVFHGAFVAGLQKGYALRQAVTFASAVAALKCTKLGGQAGIPTFQETLEFLERQGFAVRHFQSA
ncbi:PfkB domain protein [Candidatus Moduliflexus flocculans]|uniref:PfkB domain protein n=1 Tax=Candidatus Moduliflexus flocculans TaxID=1499966 RepID=A0A0S6W0N0_9BACT|nr:PfkB domain protein [Candidatus Moduliflexus flocculans]